MYMVLVWIDVLGVEVDVFIMMINNVCVGNKVEILFMIFYESNVVGCFSFYFIWNGMDLIWGMGVGGNGVNMFFIVDYS